MWKAYKEKETIGYVKMISENFNVYTENAEVILIDTFTSTEKLLSRKIIKFTEFFGSDSEEGMEELREEFYRHYGKKPENLTDLAYYCADGWSRWSADERIENPSEEVIVEFLVKHGIE